MRILQVVTLVSPDGAYGGPARVALNQSAGLRQSGTEALVAAATRGYRTIPSDIAGVPVQLFRSRTIVPGIGFAGLGAPGLYRWFSRHRAEFDLVHIHFGRDLVVLPIAAAARRHRIVYALQTHGMVEPSDHPLARPLDSMWTRKVLRGAGAVFYLTPSERDRLVAVGGDDLRLTHLHNGVPSCPRGTTMPPPTSDARDPEVLFAARLHPRKGATIFVKMARMLLDTGVQARFTLVGPDQGEGRAVREAIGAEHRVVWEGPLDSSEMTARMASASVFVLPSVREPYPMAVLEAMSVGLPVVVSDDCGLAATVARGGCGLVAAPTVEAMADAVRALLADQRLARESGERGRSIANAEFGMDGVVATLSATYSDLVGARL
ncbi:glycosyltransferase [Rhodococcus sp. NPDC003318]|uniref:glycosyltransferase n=1 Tax=Rhodococcus sp. NPDC003318 TaxID=3364503 RepID=UPI0036D115C1